MAHHERADMRTEPAPPPDGTDTPEDTPLTRLQASIARLRERDMTAIEPATSLRLTREEP